MNVVKIIEREFTSGSKFQKYDALIARITPCLENGKKAFVNFLENGVSAFGSTEFIVMRAKENACPQFAYCLAKNDKFKSHAVGSMVGSSGRQRVQLDSLVQFEIPKADNDLMIKFDKATKPMFKQINVNRLEIETLSKMRDGLLPRLMSGKIKV